MRGIGPYSLILVPSLFLYSCDCFQHADGVVLDKESKRPIANTRVANLVLKLPAGYKNYFLSDSLGRFRVNYPRLGQGLFGCPALKLTFSKAGYTSTEIVLDATTVHDTIYLDRERQH